MSHESWKTVFDYGQYLFAVMAAVCAAMNIYFGNLIDKQKEIENKKKETQAALQGKVEAPKTEGAKPLGPIIDGTVEGAQFGFGNAISKSELESQSKDNVIIQVGSLHIATPKEYLAKGIIFTQEIDLGTSSPVSLKASHGKLSVSAKIFDKSGRIVCEIEDNKWTINPNNYFTKNDDKTALEVIDQEGNVALSVELVNESLIQVYGIFPGENKITFALPNNLIALQSDPVYIRQNNLRNHVSWNEMYNRHARKIPRKFKHGEGSHGIREN